MLIKRCLVAGLLLFGCQLHASSINDLMDAIVNRNFAHAIRLVRSRTININQTWGDEGITPLMAATRVCRLDLIQLLLEYGANVNQPDAQGNSVLLHINFYGNHDVIELIKLLKHHGLNVNNKDRRGRTILWFLGSGFFDSTQHLLEVTRMMFNYGIEVDQTDYSGASLVQHASQSKIKDLVIMSCMFIKAVHEDDSAMIKSLLTLEPVLVGVTYNKKSCLDIAHELGRWKAVGAINDFFAQAIMTSAKSL